MKNKERERLQNKADRYIRLETITRNITSLIVFVAVGLFSPLWYPFYFVANWAKKKSIKYTVDAWKMYEKDV